MDEVESFNKFSAALFLKITEQTSTMQNDQKYLIRGMVYSALFDINSEIDRQRMLQQHENNVSSS